MTLSICSAINRRAICWADWSATLGYHRRKRNGSACRRHWKSPRLSQKLTASGTQFNNLVLLVRLDDQGCRLLPWRGLSKISLEFVVMCLDKGMWSRYCWEVMQEEFVIICEAYDAWCLIKDFVNLHIIISHAYSRSCSSLHMTLQAVGCIISQDRPPGPLPLNEFSTSRKLKSLKVELKIPNSMHPGIKFSAGFTGDSRSTRIQMQVLSNTHRRWSLNIPIAWQISCGFHLHLLTRLALCWSHALWRQKK